MKTAATAVSATMPQKLSAHDDEDETARKKNACLKLMHEHGVRAYYGWMDE